MIPNEHLKRMIGWNNTFIGKCVSTTMYHLLRIGTDIRHRKL